MILEGWEEVESAVTGLKSLNTSQRWDKWVIGPDFILKAPPPCLWAEQGLGNVCSTSLLGTHVWRRKDAKQRGGKVRE